MEGQILSHYKILERLGGGGMGVVYRARDTRLARQVAVKVLRPDASPDPERKARLKQEARSASALNHPNIITIYDIDTANGLDFIAMEYVDGKSLASLIAAGPLPPDDALKYAVQMASALAAAHEAGIVHRDIKPANIMLTTSGQVKVLDFGVAKLRETVTDSSASTLTALAPTTDGVVLGTPAYMSPEQAQGRLVDARSDVFSFGAVLYEMLARRRPFTGDSHESLLAAICDRQPAPLREGRGDVPADLELIVWRSLKKDPAARYQSGTELVVALTACQTRLAARRIALLTALRRPSVAIATALIVVALAGAGTWWAVHSSRVRWTRQIALPEIARLADREDFDAAFRLLKDAERYIPGDPAIRRPRPIRRVRHGR
jgi:serine/threonine protein kinase